MQWNLTSLWVRLISSRYAGAGDWISPKGLVQVGSAVFLPNAKEWTLSSNAGTSGRAPTGVASSCPPMHPLLPSATSASMCLVMPTLMHPLSPFCMQGLLVPLYAARATEEVLYGKRGVTLSTAKEVTLSDAHPLGSTRPFCSPGPHMDM